ncbi:MAG: SIS domain protein [Candidatus Xenolissoclinum pacificiensis L6]|uniref:Glutamine--fructose-6-phosphate aminotransferase [isomerizing] n=1 Tax=Candidatus Xenolissoclinum pacificiensis L6 TaxID=1401685 RepID=W2V053_9RICK|nr:MAG: SIS domain protein [Candidatus Xenolissoclinum pacificiensis L6]
MCGILALVKKHAQDAYCGNECIPLLKRLERRGYDSVGVLLKNQDQYTLHKSIGSVDCFLNKYKQKLDTTCSNCILGHTRWATHGQVSEENAHPKCNGNIAIVHNGVVENFVSLRNWLSNIEKIDVETIQSDTTLLLHVVQYFLDESPDIQSAFRKALKKIEGIFAIVVLFLREKNTELYGMTKGTDLICGVSDSEICVTSDLFSVSERYNEYLNISTEELLYISNGKLTIYNAQNQIKITNDNISENTYKTVLTNISKYDNYSSYFLAEMHEQPDIVHNLLTQKMDSEMLDLVHKLSIIKKVIFVSCGSSYIATNIAKYWLRSINIEAYVEYASEYSNYDHHDDKIVVFVSQSGETMDTVNCAKLFKNHHYTVALVNNVNSALSRVTNHVNAMNIREELSVVATKSFTSQLACLYRIYLGLKNNKIKFVNIADTLREVISYVTNKIDILLPLLKEYTGFMFTGRGEGYGIAQEGALKMKELAYVYSDAVPCGELKHGSIALLGEGLCVVFFLPNDSFLYKNLITLHEIYARSHNVLIVADNETSQYLSKFSKAYVTIVPKIHNLYVFSHAIFIQILAYKVAVTVHNNIDRPRNLAKCVTVV